MKAARVVGSRWNFKSGHTDSHAPSRASATATWPWRRARSRRFRGRRHLRGEVGDGPGTIVNRAHDFFELLGRRIPRQVGEVLGLAQGSSAGSRIRTGG